MEEEAKIRVREKAVRKGYDVLYCFGDVWVMYEYEGQERPLGSNHVPQFTAIKETETFNLQTQSSKFYQHPGLRKWILP